MPPPTKEVQFVIAPTLVELQRKINAVLDLDKDWQPFPPRWQEPVQRWVCWLLLEK